MIPIASPVIGEEERAAVLRVLESGVLAQGPAVDAFETAFAERLGVRHAVAVGSGSAALLVALLAHGVGEGDEVITTPFSFIASANAVLFAGARPRFVDVREDDFNIDPELIERMITPRTKAIIPVHLYGNPCRMDDIEDHRAPPRLDDHRGLLPSPRCIDRGPSGRVIRYRLLSRSIRPRT